MNEKLAGEGSSETSMHVTQKQIFPEALFAASIADDLFFLAAEEPIAWVQKTTAHLLLDPWC